MTSKLERAEYTIVRFLFPWQQVCGIGHLLRELLKRASGRTWVLKLAVLVFLNFCGRVLWYSRETVLPKQHITSNMTEQILTCKDSNSLSLRTNIKLYWLKIISWRLAGSSTDTLHIYKLLYNLCIMFKAKGYYFEYKPSFFHLKHEGQPFLGILIMW